MIIGCLLILVIIGIGINQTDVINNLTFLPNPPLTLERDGLVYVPCVGKCG